MQYGTVRECCLYLRYQPSPDSADLQPILNLSFIYHAILLYLYSFKM